MVFPSIGALVCDGGGAISHPAIIAREFGIPAVVATGAGTEAIPDGSRVRVDGTVRRASPSSAPRRHDLHPERARGATGQVRLR